MHIAYVHQYFATPNGSTGTRSYEFARRWVAAGHRVTMLTSTAQLTPADVPNGDLDRRSEFEIKGIRVIALPVKYSQQMGRLSRIVAFLRFMWTSTWTLLRLPDVDLVFATSTPLTVGIPALVRQCLRRTPFVFEVRDLWPEIPYELGYLPGGPILWFLRWFERCVYRSASKIVALSPGMRDGVVSAGVPHDQVVVVPNCCDTERFRPDIDGTVVRNARGWEGRFVCVHIGAIGMTNGLDLVIRTAQRLRDDPDYLLVLVGDGRERPRLMKMAEERELTNVQFPGNIPKDELPGIFAAADVSLVVFAPFSILQHNSANKLFDSLSAGKPVVLNYSGWQRDMLEAAGAGLGCEQGDEATFVANIKRLKVDPQLRRQMGCNARRLAETRFDRSRLSARVLKQIECAYR